jgi:hypothetical protein
VSTSTKVEQYRVELRRLKVWEPYLKKHSHLPGPRGNLELVAAVVEEGDPDRLWRLSASTDEFLAVCGTAGLGRVALMEPVTVMTWLRELAADSRWRVREAVAIALQRFGREGMPRLIAEMKVWAGDGPYVQRAAAAALCEPVLLKSPQDIVEVLAILDRITKSLGASTDRRADGFKVLRQALGYCWSVAAAASPQNARPYLEKWLHSTDKDIAWVMKTNLGKARMASMRGSLAGAAPARPTGPARRVAARAPKATAPAKPRPKSKPTSQPKPGTTGTRRPRR